jgi:hypothetical protein
LKMSKHCLTWENMLTYNLNSQALVLGKNFKILFFQLIESCICWSKECEWSLSTEIILQSSSLKKTTVLLYCVI